MNESQTTSIATTAEVQSKDITVSCHEISAATMGHQSELYWAWKSLFESDPAARIIEHPDYLLLEIATSLKNNPTLPPASIVICQQDNKNIAAAVLMPKEINTKKAGAFIGSSRLKGYRLAGDRILGDQSESIAFQLLAETQQVMQQQKCSFLLIEDLEHESTLQTATEQIKETGCQLYSPTGLQERLRIQLPPSIEVYWQSFNSKSRYNLKRNRKTLEKKGTVIIKRFDQIEQVADLLEDAHRVSLNTWQTRQLGLRINTTDADLEAFTFLAIEEALRSYILYLNDEPIAFLIGNQHNGTFHYEEVGFDTDYARSSPGKVLLVAVLEDVLSENRPDWFDFGLGDAEYKRQMSNRQSQSGTLWIVPNGFKNNTVITWIKSCRTIKATIRKVLQSTGLFTRLRQLLRRTKGGK